MALRVLCTTLAALAVLAGASPDFLAPQGGDPLEELERELSGSASREVLGPGRLLDLEEALRTTFTSLPKNRLGNLAPAAVRYALHRLFIQRHGWSVAGLAPTGQTWNASSPVEILRGRVPERSRLAFEERLRVRGFGLHETAVFAAALEGLIHREAAERIRAAYGAHGLSPGSNVTEKVAERVIDTFMMGYIVGASVSEMTPRWARKMSKAIEQVFPAWPASKKFADKVRAEAAPRTQGAWAFDDVERVVTLVADGYGLVQNRECLSMKKQLVALEEEDTSCVGLNKFYGGNVHEGQWQFGENVEYLREAGMLEESEPGHPRVIVANYVNGLSNCLASSSFYSVCCINECEGLMDRLEREVAAPEAAPAQIAALVAALPSASVSAGRQLPASLLLRLEEIGQRHGGQVPLHGRLFGQWMHHAYPQECPYPHVSGTTKQLHIEAWEAQRGQSIAMSQEGMSQHAGRQGPKEGTGTGTCVPWTAEEELVVPLTRDPAMDAHAAWMVACSGAVLTAFASILLGLVRKQKRALSSRSGKGVAISAPLPL